MTALTNGGGSPTGARSMSSRCRCLHCLHRRGGTTLAARNHGVADVGRRSQVVRYGTLLGPAHRHRCVFRFVKTWISMAVIAPGETLGGKIGPTGCHAVVEGSGNRPGNRREVDCLRYPSPTLPDTPTEMLPGTC